ncbi:unnamed protein product, partial [Rotaria socialis]
FLLNYSVEEQYYGPFSGSLSLRSVDSSDDGDYVCVASNVIGRSFSSIRSLIVTGKN